MPYILVIITELVLTYYYKCCFSVNYPLLNPLMPVVDKSTTLFQISKSCKNILKHLKDFIFSPDNLGGLWRLNDLKSSLKILIM